MTVKTLSRKELYDLVWSKPVTHIAKAYGFSDNGIRKICKKHNIPLPKSGYWAKVKYNKKVKKEKLPKQETNPLIKLEKTNPALFSCNHILSEMAIRKKELKEIEELSFIVPDRLSKPHKYVVATKEYHKKLKIVHKRGGWRNEIDNTDVLSVSVSDNILSRGLRIFDTLIKVFEKRGYTVNIDNKTEVVIKEQTYAIRITEKTKRVKREDNSSWDSYDYVPTGRICLKIDDSYPVKEWADSKTKLLEDRILDILAWLESRAKRDEERAREHEIRREQQEIQRVKQEELQKLKDDELTNFEGLFHTASRWHKSQYLRNYIKEFEEYAIKSNTLDSEKKEWLKWAKEKADWYDPFIEKDIELLKDIDRDTLKLIKKKYW